MRSGEVAERSNAADCKSVALVASEVRILPSPPTFARRGRRAELRLASQRAGRRLRAEARSGCRRSKAGCGVGELWIEIRGCGPARHSAGWRSGRHEGGSNSVVESQPSKLLVAGSIPVSRSSLRAREMRARFG